MEKLRSLKPVIVFHLLLNGIVILFITGASYYHTPLEGFKDTAIYLGHLLLLQTTVAGMLYFLSLNKWIFHIVFSALFLMYCGFSFWAYTQDISITMPLIQSVVETKSDIAIDLISTPYILFFVVAILALHFILKRQRSIQPTKGFLIFVIPALLAMCLFFALEKIRPGSLVHRLPYNAVLGLKHYYKKPTLQLNKEISELRFKEDSLKLVFVLGETVRADHLGINGYERNTTPLLAQKTNIISFKNLHTNNTYTGASVPQILTDEMLESKEASHTSIYSVVNKANFKTTWIGNQTLEKSFTPIVYTNSEVILVDKYKSEYSFNKELDEVMLAPLDSVLTLSSRQFTTLHMMGSHWWYENRYTEKHREFRPVIDSKYVPSLSSEQMINSYDNTILYLDFFLAEIIDRLEKEEEPSLLFYISDHGEHLGENGKWLHAQAGDVAKNPAYIIWFSEKYIEKYPKRVLKITELKDNKLTTDIVYYTLLDLLGININK